MKDNKGNTADFYLPKERKQQFQPFASQASILSPTYVSSPANTISGTLPATPKITPDGADSEKQHSQETEGLEKQTTIFQRIQLQQSSDDLDHTNDTPDREKHSPKSQEKMDITPQSLKQKVDELLNKPDDYFCTQNPVVSKTLGTKDEGVTQVEQSQKSESSTTIASRQAEVSQNGTSKVEKEETIQQNEQMVPEPPLFDSEKACWEVELYEDVNKVLKSCQVHRRNQIFETIQTLASGYWNTDLKKQIETGSSSCVLFEARINREDRLIYEIARRLSEKDTDKVQELTNKAVHVYSQKIIVWDVVFNHKGLNKHAQRVVKMIERVKERVKARVTPVSEGKAQGNCRIPQRFVDSDMTKKDLEEIARHFKVEPSKKREDEMGVKMYSLTTQLALAISNSEHDRRDYPIKLTDEEYDIIRMPESEPVVVLGRSGTGKTTTCLCRLWMGFKDYWNANDKVDNPSIYKQTDETTIGGSSDGQDTSCEISISTQNDASNIGSEATTIESETPLSHANEDCEHLRQIFITKNAALCAKMKERFYDFVAGHEPARAHFEHENDKLTKTFSEVTDLGYPLFLTARQFFLMLDKSLDDEQEYFHPRDKIIHSDRTGKNMHHMLLKNFDSDTDDEDDELATKPREKVEVTASYFEKYIWSCIAKHCSDDKTDPLMIWMEIQSFIKGSKEALDSEGGILSEDDYVKLGRKRAPNFPLDRKEVYNLFLAYNNLKHQDIKRDHFDHCDFVYKLYTRLQTQSAIKVRCIHRIYVDEVQDFTHAELSVILRCCADPNGFFLAGDTAQCIIKGISFRFEDLLSLFHDLKESLGRTTKVHCNRPSGIKKLTINHRSHSGVTELAISVTDLLQEFFPLSFDWQHVPKDISNINGPKPLFLCSKSQLEDFLDLHSKSEIDLSSVEFGADQAIIIRDKEGEVNLPEYLKGIVLKVQQCKGLEFNDVLLYNFFTDSQVSWWITIS